MMNFIKTTPVYFWMSLAVLVILALLASILLLAPGSRAAPARGALEGAPGLINFQGYLTDDTGVPLNEAVDLSFELYGTASGGASLWSETHSGVTVLDGFFSVNLGAINPFTPTDFSATTRYLEIAVDRGAGFVTLPRQQFTAVPYALQAAAVPWSGVADIPPGVENGSPYAQVIIVAKSGGDYTSVAAAVNSITNAAADNPFLVWIAPGTYIETELVAVDPYVHLQGAGQETTVISATRTASSPTADAATVELLDHSRISDLTVVNEGTGTFGIALYSASTGRETVIERVTGRAMGAGGTGHYVAYLNDAGLTIQNSFFHAGGAIGFGTAVNAAVGSVNISAGFPQALITDSILIGGINNNLENCVDPSGTGFGLQLSNSSPVVRNSYICGGHRGIAVYTNGHPQIQNSSIKVSSTGAAYLFEISASGSISVADSGVSYIGNKFTGAGTGLRCVNVYDLGTYTPKTNGTTAATACN